MDDFETCEHGNLGHCPICYQEWQADMEREAEEAYRQALLRAQAQEPPILDGDVEPW